jgi:hypothetical protein
VRQREEERGREARSERRAEERKKKSKKQRKRRNPEAVGLWRVGQSPNRHQTDQFLKEGNEIKREGE